MSCSAQYRSLQTVQQGIACINLKPLWQTTSWYSAKIDVVGKHISGLLLVKPFEDGYRVVFTNEAGVTFFDFSFLKNGEFKVIRIMEKLNKKAIVNLLEDDFSLMLGIPFLNHSLKVMKSQEELFHGAPQKKHVAYFITAPDCASLYRLEMGSARKRLVEILFNGPQERPEVITIRHFTFQMQMEFHRIERNAAE